MESKRKLENRSSCITVRVRLFAPWRGIQRGGAVYGKFQNSNLYQQLSLTKIPSRRSCTYSSPCTLYSIFQLILIVLYSRMDGRMIAKSITQMMRHQPISGAWTLIRWRWCSVTWDIGLRDSLTMTLQGTEIQMKVLQSVVVQVETCRTTDCLNNFCSLCAVFFRFDNYRFPLVDRNCAALQLKYSEDIRKVVQFPSATTTRCGVVCSCNQRALCLTACVLSGLSSTDACLGYGCWWLRQQN
jgi:hypothetical protein